MRWLMIGAKHISLALAGVLLIVGHNLHILPQANDGQRIQHLEDELRRIKGTEPAEETPWTTSYWDAGQNVRLTSIDEHLKATDANITEVQKELNALARELSDMEGRSTVWFSIIGGLVVASIGISGAQILRGKKE